jgi:PTH1 family peptidyl-tRNA hydrolase
VESEINAPPGSLKSPRLIVGLGNPGKEYRDTRHNAGFMVLDEVAQRMKVDFQLEKRWNALSARAGNIWLLKPQTFMNESGSAVNGLLRYHKLTAPETLVVFDDVDLPLGTLRMRPSGSAGGHNGMRSIIAHLGTDMFPRLKLGIAPGPSGRPAGEKLSSHVLGRFSEAERPALGEMIQRAADAVMQALQTGVDAAMNVFNRK